MRKILQRKDAKITKMRQGEWDQVCRNSGSFLASFAFNGLG